MAWVALIFAGIFEMFGVAMISKLHKDRNWQAVVLLIVGFGASFLLLAYSMKQHMLFGQALEPLEEQFWAWFIMENQKI